MLASSSGDETAISAARIARSSPLAVPIPIRAEPAPCITDLTSAKSKLIRPGVVIKSVIPCTPARSTSSAVLKASTTETDLFAISKSLWLGTTIKVSTSARSASMPRSACCILRLPSKPNGLVTTPTVSAPTRFATRATIGAAPVPVPPPSPAVTKTMSEPRRAASISSS
ncbi:unannotated protein [freshwater metagenome]|uniref:Unannotated protein n=1 Tax=freshwater metagenome TaxID=449393 RepID=A0A6J6J232_9ZZZZ